MLWISGAGSGEQYQGESIVQGPAGVWVVVSQERASSAGYGEGHAVVVFRDSQQEWNSPFSPFVGSRHRVFAGGDFPRDRRCAE
ncbi:MAG: hypothetical protein ACKPHU_20410, partial [Planctomycetaceae bacterium]